MVNQDLESLGKKVEMSGSFLEIGIFSLIQSPKLFQQVDLNQTAQDVDRVN